MSTLDERTARMALCALQPMGNVELVRLVDEVGAPAVWEAVSQMGEASRWGRKSVLVDSDWLVYSTKEVGARFLIPGDDEWPDGIEDLARAQDSGEGGPPLGLWARGPLNARELAGGVGIVGSRVPSSYGTHVATDWAGDIAASGRVVISGMAFGIDAAAHRGALMAQRPTAALLACGVDTAYPLANGGLMRSILDTGLVLSEVPPGTRPIKAAFLARNRLIAALSQGVLVVEATARSGAKNTAGWASDLGRVVMAVPGPVTAAQSATPNRLIRDQVAASVTSPLEVLSLLGPLSPQDELPLRGEDTRFDQLSPTCRMLREVIAVGEEIGTAEVSARSGLTIANCLAGLDELVEGGWLEELPNGAWRLPVRS